jgi:two-component system cell cycle sensor histidine kinase/response regulator CckA
MAGALRVLLVEDSEDDAMLVLRELRRAGWHVDSERVETAAAMAEALTARPWDLVLADYALPTLNALDALRVLRAHQRDIPLIIVSGAIGEETAVAAMKAGASDYVSKGHLRLLVPAVERELREAKDRLALVRERELTTLLVVGVSALIIGLDVDARVTAFNRAAERFTGRRRETVIGHDWFTEMVPSDRRHERRALFDSFLRTGSPAEYEGEILTGDGTTRLIGWRMSQLHADDRVVGVLGFGVDLTEQRRAEAEREAMAQAARRAEKLAALGTLAAGLAHELNNPIGIMSSRIELMLTDETGLSEEAREDLRVLHRQAQRVARITQGLLSFARRSSGDTVPVDLNHVVNETVMLVERQFTKAGVRVQVHLAPDLPAILGDADALQQVVLNLVTNARDALGGGGELRIATAVRQAEPPMVELVIADTGPGIAPEHLTHVFDPFFTTKSTGTGLGLSITHGIVREHRGTIDVRSAPGQGTRFVLTFPSVTADLG